MEREYTTTTPPASPPPYSPPDMTGSTTSRRQYIGVRAARGRWVVHIREPYNGSRIWLGSYRSPIAAARAYDTTLFYLRGPSACFNFPEVVEAEVTRELGFSVAQIRRLAMEVGARVDAMHATGIDTLSSYEEMLALEERIGNVSTGLSEEAVAKSLKQYKYTSMEEERCCICQEEYVEGDDLGRLDCGHDFHINCIKQWLTHKNLCPICKNTVLIA